MANQRGKLFIDRAVQGTLVKRVIVHWFAFFGITLCLLGALDFLTGDPNRTMFQWLGEVWQKNAAMIFVLLALLPAFVYDTLRMSHRFAGPIFRLRNSLKQLASQGETAPIHFREKDFWGELANDFNEVAEKVRRGDAGEYKSVEVAESESVYVPSITATTSAPTNQTV